VSTRGVYTRCLHEVHSLRLDTDSRFFMLTNMPRRFYLYIRLGKKSGQNRTEGNVIM